MTEGVLLENVPGSRTARAIDPNPILTVLLEPRSLMITRGSLYATHLHGIREVSGDHFLNNIENQRSPILADLGVVVDNWDMVSDPSIRAVMQEGGSLLRGTRYSLTCRDVERVWKAKPITGL